MVRARDLSEGDTIRNSVTGKLDVVVHIQLRPSFSIVKTKRGKRLFETDTNDCNVGLEYWDLVLPDLEFD